MLLWVLLGTFSWPLLQPCVPPWPAPGKKGVYSLSTGTHTSLHTPNFSVTVLQVSPLGTQPLGLCLIRAAH